MARAVSVAVTAGTAVFLVSRVASANTGIPAMAVAWPVMWVMLAPICVVEALMARRALGISWKLALKTAVGANLVSTFVGVPLAWILLTVVGYIGVAASSTLIPKPAEWTMLPFAVLAFAGWLPPLEGAPWLVFVGATLFCVPFYFASVWVETDIAIRMLPDVDGKAIRRWVKRANQVSYLIIAASTTTIGVYYAVTMR